MAGKAPQNAPRSARDEYDKEAAVTAATYSESAMSSPFRR
jgi:hypothetical protein